MTISRKMIVTSALPYANGHLHLGHLLEHIQTDIWVRTHKMLGIECISICGEDAHGTPIMLKAEQLGLLPEELTAQMRESHEADFAAFFIHYDAYHTTHSKENEKLATSIFKKLQEKNSIITKTIRQLYDPQKEMFLPDRYVKGTCPRCQAKDQYGDNCEVCGASYSPTELTDAVSAISGARPIIKESEHYFFNLPEYESFLKDWTRTKTLQTEMIHKLDEWFKEGLKPWDISRDAPYFGFKIPGTDDKFFYVWLDAPIGYMASFQKFCAGNEQMFNEFWQANAKTELYHFVGKDIMYFHALFWPALLHASGYRLPTAIFAHGFLTVNGLKMSKSRGTFIEARVYRKYLNPEYLRYYFAAKLTSRVEDLDLNLDDFVAKINADLIGKVINIASRCAGFINKRFAGKLSSQLENLSLYQQILKMREEIIKQLIDRDYAQVVRKIMEAADQINQYIDAKKPWVLAKDEALSNQVQDVCSMGLNLYRLLITYLKPILPALAKASEEFLNCEELDWQVIDKPLLNHQINNFIPLMMRIDPEKIGLMLNESQGTI